MCIPALVSFSNVVVRMRNESGRTPIWPRREVMSRRGVRQSTSVRDVGSSRCEVAQALPAGKVHDTYNLFLVGGDSTYIALASAMCSQSGLP